MSKEKFITLSSSCIDLTYFVNVSHITYMCLEDYNNLGNIYTRVHLSTFEESILVKESLEDILKLINEQP